MILKFFKNTVLLFVFVLMSCGNKSKLSALKHNSSTKSKMTKAIEVGASRTDMYLGQLTNKRVGIVANQTSVIYKTQDSTYTHLVDSLRRLGVTITKVFAPEHGFRGSADAGEFVKDGIDTKTGVPIISLYGSNKKPSATHLKTIDVMLFDIQDVGARFYTYISSLHFVMEACAEANIPIIILDRPNPNGHYIDGPTLEPKHKSFVGMHPVPVVHGMTIGEYAKMIQGEGWLNNNATTQLTVIPVKHYNHTRAYPIPIKPSPNLPNDTAIHLYPSLCFFEGTTISVGRGTDKQFQVYGAPFLNRTKFNYTFVPKPNAGAKYPKHQGKQCFGVDLSNEKPLNKINLKYLIEAYQGTANKNDFFIKNGFFTKLAGTTKLQEQIENNLTEAEIKATWQEDLEAFKQIRAQYLIYD